MKLLRLSVEEAEQLGDSLEKEALGIVRNAFRMAWGMRGGVDFNDVMNMPSKFIELIDDVIDENLTIAKKTNLPFF